MKTIEKINKAFDEKFTEVNGFGNKFLPYRGEEVKSFYTQQILSLIEEIHDEACKGYPRDSTYEKCGFSVTDIKQVKAFDNGWHLAKRLLFNHLDQMRASIKELKNNL